MNGGIIRVTWLVVAMLSLLPDAGLSALAMEFGGSSTTDGINFGNMPRLLNLHERSFSVWINQDTQATQDAIVMSIHSDMSGPIFYVDGDPTNRIIAFYSNTYAVDGKWVTPVNVYSLSAWVHLAVTYNEISDSNDPIIYINGSAQSLTEEQTPSGALGTESGENLIIGNWLTASQNFTRAFDGKIFDARVYNRILTQAEITTLYNSGTPDETLLTDPSTGLVFQACAVRTGELADYVDDTLTSTTLVRDAVFGAVGVPHGSPIGRAAP